jgi:uncharacterized protein (DUF58 family)
VAASKPWQRLRRTLAVRASRWARKRQGPDPLPTVLHARRIYILPTRAGAGLAVLLLAMLAAGLNYNNSLALLLTFTLTGFELVGLYQCHRRLLGLQIQAIGVEPAFAGEQLVVTLRLAQTAAGAAAELEGLLREDHATVATATATGTALAPRIDLHCPATRRGLWRLESVSLRTCAPSGLFRAWVWLYPDVSAPIYPRPYGTLPLPEAAGDESGSRDPVSGMDEWTTLRPFRDGDSPRQVAWKAYARGAPLLVKEYRGQSGQQHEFDFAALAGLDEETRLSQLCQWIVTADRRGESYALRLPGSWLAADCGPQHLRQCLTALALFGTQAPRQAR